MVDILHILSYGPKASKNYKKIEFIYKTLKTYEIAFGWKTIKEFNKIFEKYFDIKDSKTGEKIKIERLIINKKGELNPLLLMYLKLYPRRSDIGINKLSELLDKYWTKVLFEYFETDKETLIKKMNEGTIEYLKKIIYIFTKKLNKNDRTFSVRSYNLIFNSELIPQLKKTKKTAEDILKEMEKEGKIYIGEDNYVYIGR